ncbi:MAG: type II toxin-antitoxin system RelB/DinJ family antitoxin [Clostridia bacterium]
MAKVSTNISLDPNLKKSAQELFSDLGLDLSTAVTLFLSQAVREQKIPFEIKRNIPNNNTIMAMNEFNEMKNNPQNYPRYSSFKDAMKDVLDDA